LPIFAEKSVFFAQIAYVAGVRIAPRDFHSVGSVAMGLSCLGAVMAIFLEVGEKNKE